MTKACF